MTLTFDLWLNAQQNRSDPIGDLARVPSMSTNPPLLSGRGANEHKNWADLVIRIPEPGHIAVFNDAWQEFLIAKEAAQEPLA